LDEAFNLKTVVKVLGVYYGMIGELRSIDSEDPLTGLVGRFYRFINIDPKEPWFNLDKNEPATEAEMAKVVIPEFMRPGMTMFNFVFYPKGHKLYFEVHDKKGSLGSSSVKKLLDTVFAAPSITQAFGTVDITVIPAKEQLEKIFAINRLSKLIIEITRPNSDGGEEYEEQVMKRLERQNARQERIEYTAIPNTTIEPDDETKKLAKVASHNGRVSGKGTDLQGKKVILSTISHSWTEIIVYDSDTQTQIDALVDQTRSQRHDI